MRRRGFSLVELSIVLVIIGLLVGGLLAGQSLIKAAQLRDVANEASQFTIALNGFKDKYFALPGDMPNATQFWGDEGGCAAWHSITIPAKATCNGNYDNMILTSQFALDERFLAWQHLANAGLIEGVFTGKSASTGNAPTLGINVPKSKLNEAYWQIFWIGTLNGDTNYFDGEYKNGAWLTRGTGGGALLAGDLSNIDLKMDDGKPASGRLRSLKKTSTWSPNCATADDTSAIYASTDMTTMCIAMLDFAK